MGAWQPTQEPAAAFSKSCGVWHVTQASCPDGLGPFGLSSWQLVHEARARAAFWWGAWQSVHVPLAAPCALVAGTGLAFASSDVIASAPCTCLIVAWHAAQSP